MSRICRSRWAAPDARTSRFGSGTQRVKMGDRTNFGDLRIGQCPRGLPLLEPAGRQESCGGAKSAPQAEFDAPRRSGSPSSAWLWARTGEVRSRPAKIVPMNSCFVDIAFSRRFVT